MRWLRLFVQVHAGLHTMQVGQQRPTIPVPLTRFGAGPDPSRRSPHGRRFPTFKRGVIRGVRLYTGQYVFLRFVVQSARRNVCVWRFRYGLREWDCESIRPLVVGTLKGVLVAEPLKRLRVCPPGEADLLWNMYDVSSNRKMYIAGLVATGQCRVLLTNWRAI